MVAEPIASVSHPFVSTAKRDVADLVGIMAIVALRCMVFIPSIVALCLLSTKKEMINRRKNIKDFESLWRVT